MVEPRIGIITALEKECAAVIALLESPTEVDVPGSGGGGHYYIGEVPARDGRKHTIVLCRAGMGTNIAAVRTTLLFQHFQTIRFVIMVGIAGGVPNPAKVEEHVRLGDIVVSDEGGVRQYDFGKDIAQVVDGETHFEFKERDITRSPGATLVGAVQDLTVAAWGGDKPWIKYISDACKRLSVLRPPDETDVLLDTLDPTKVVKHPDDPARVPGQPRLFSGKIASANVLLKNPLRRDYLREKFRVRAVEMESAGIADAAWLAEKGYLVVRGISDYCDSGKNDIWQEYAAIVAAGYARALIESLPTPDGRDGTVVPSTSLSLEQYLAAVKVLAETDPYISFQGLAEVPHIPLWLRRKYPKNDKERSPGVLASVINEKDELNVMFIAPAGAGKSTLLRELARHAWHSPELLGSKKRYLPMLIRLSAFATKQQAVLENGLTHAIYKAGELLLPGELPDGFFSSWSNEAQAPWFLLFDGLDEVASAQRLAVISKLSTMLETFKDQGHRIAITSRPGDLQQLESKLTAYEALGFTPKQQKEFAHSCFGSAGDDFLNEIKRLEAEEFAGNPLLFRTAAIVFERDRLLVKNKASLYERFVQVWLDQAGTLGLKEDLGDLEELIPVILDQLALQMTEQPDDRSSVVLSNKLAGYLKDTFGTPVPQAVAQAKKLVTVLGRRSGVFTELGNVCDWAHSNFREYLAGRALSVQLIERKDDYATVLGDRPFDIHWSEVIRTLVQIHPKPTELVNWIASEALRKEDVQSALLVHYYWTHAHDQNDAEDWHGVVDVLIAALADRQGALRGPQMLKDALVEMGDRAVPALLASLKRLNGLQAELLPNWEGKRPPDFHEPFGEHLWQGRRQRSAIIEVLGRIKNPSTFDEIISLLQRDPNDSYRSELRERILEALMCIGEGAVEPLLLVAGDPKNSTEKRRQALFALKRVGRRSGSVSDTLNECLTEGLSGNFELLKAALSAAAGLRDHKQVIHAAEALKLNNQEVVAMAAEFFSSLPDSAVVNELFGALQRWDGMEPHPFNSGFGMKRLLSALSLSGTLLANRIVSDVISSSVRGRGKLEPRDALREIGSLSINGLPNLLLTQLLRELPKSEPTLRPSDLLDVLNTLWRPEDLRELVRLTQRIENVVGKAGVDALVSRYLTPGEAEAEVERSYADESAVLQTLAKCQVQQFAKNAARLLEHAEWDFLRELSDVLWISGDVAAEEALLNKLRSIRTAEANSESPTPELYHVIRALGTCGTARGADEVVDTIVWNPRIDPDFSSDVLRVLLQRGLVNTNRLMALAKDPKTNEYARNFFVEGLGFFDAPSFGSLFEKTVLDDNEEVRINSANFLGWSREPNVAALLVHLLETTDSVSVAEASASSLVRLKFSAASGQIIKAIERFGPKRGAGLIRAAARLKDPSIVKYLKGTTRHNEWTPWERGDLLEAVGEFYDESWARTILDDWLENTRVGYDTAQQRWAFGVLANCDPNKLLIEATRLYDQDGLESSARTRLATLLRKLIRSHRCNPSLLLPFLKRLTCDEDLWMRESVGEDLIYLDRKDRLTLYEELKGMSNEWGQACGVHSLGFWDSDEKEIRRMTYSAVGMIRYFADRALAMRLKRPALHELSNSFLGSDGAARVSSYLALVEHGNEQFLYYIDERREPEDPISLFLPHMQAAVQARAKTRQEKLMKKEAELFCKSSREIKFSRN